MSNNLIQRLMQQPADDHDPAWLQSALQAAIQLELATLPQYLCALFSIGDRTSVAFKLIKDIVFNEMTHFGLACNLLLPQPEVSLRLSVDVDIQNTPDRYPAG